MSYMTDWSKLKRAKQPMQRFVRQALKAADLMNAYKARPAYQQNDYLSWITRAKREETQQKRLNQMIAELERGDVYMNMAWGK